MVWLKIKKRQLLTSVIFYKSLSECKRKQKEWYTKGLDVSKITNCPKWQSDYEKGRTVVLLTLEPYQITTQYIYK